jgi:transcriptional regulator with XRE-family HTH domain
MGASEKYHNTGFFLKDRKALKSMNTNELQQLKMAWIAAKEVGDSEMQLHLLRDHPEEQEALIDFIAAYHATDLKSASTEMPPAALAALTQRAAHTALERVFASPVPVASLIELRTQRGFSLINVAKGLRLGIDVWKKFESGAIELASLSERQLQRLATFFQVTTDQFASLLSNSQPSFTLDRRQTNIAARSKQQSPPRQSFTEAIEKSTMTKAEKRFWLE